MKRRRIVSAIAVLALFGAAFFAVSQPKAAQATTEPTVTSYDDVNIGQVIAHGNDDLTLLGCLTAGRSNTTNNVYGGVESNVDGYPSNPSSATDDFGCEPRMGSQVDNDVTGPDGTVYGYYEDYSSYPFAFTIRAERNGQILWSTLPSLSSDCGSSHVPGKPGSISIGSDGNLYTTVSMSSCEWYMLAINAQTGAIIHTIDLGMDSYVTPSVWTYSDKIVAVDTSGEIHQYGYGSSYTEDTDARYTFPGSPATGTVMADSAGDVYNISGTSYNIYEHAADGTNHTTSSPGATTYALGPDGHLLNFNDGGTIYNLDVAAGTFTSHSPSIPSGFTKAQTYFSNPHVISDTDGNVVDVLQLTQNSSGYPAVDVQYIDGSTGSTTDLFTAIGSSSNDPELGNAIAGNPDVYGDFMYVPIATGATSGSTPNYNSQVVKIDVADAGFGTVVRTVHGFDPVSASGGYVALGDSYASGQGFSPYMPGTDTSSNPNYIGPTDECRRSTDAFEFGLANALNLSFDSFAACGGATYPVITGADSNNNEPAQYLAISGSTKLVTISLGGDDAGFPSTITACDTEQTEPQDAIDEGLSQTDYDEYACLQNLSDAHATIGTSSFKQHLEDVYSDVESRSGGNAVELVLGYPELLPTDSELSNDSSCKWGNLLGNLAGDADNRAITSSDITALRGDTDELNDVIQQAITAAGNSNIQYVPMDEEFDNHDVCSSTPWINGTVDNPASQASSFHPNAAGTAAYQSEIETFLEENDSISNIG